MKKRLLAMALALISVLTIAAGAATTYQNIRAEYGIRLVINGQTPTLTDVNGKVVRPFVVEGTTYVPIRAVTDAIDGYVDYDHATNTASIESFGGESDMWTLFVLSGMTSFTSEIRDVVHSLILTLHTGYTDAEFAQHLAEFERQVAVIDSKAQELQGYVDQINTYEPYYNEINQIMPSLNRIPNEMGRLLFYYEQWRETKSDVATNNLGVTYVNILDDVYYFESAAAEIYDEIFSVFD